MRCTLADVPEASPASESPQSVFGRRLRELRERLGRTQADVSRDLAAGGGPKIDHSGVARIERGERSVRLNEAVSLAALFGLTVDELLAGAVPVVEQVRQAEEHVERTRFQAGVWSAEYETAVGRLARLRERVQREDAGRG